MNMTTTVSSVYTSLTSSVDTGFVATVLIVFNWIVFGLVGPLLALFGIGTNIINMICFQKQGFKDQINISLLGMAVSDLGSLVTIFCANVVIFLPIYGLDVWFDAIEMTFMTTGILHTLFTRITAWITAFITLERCLCIAMPLKVKNIITSRRVGATIVSIFIVLFIGQAPLYFIGRLDIKYFPERNKTLIGIIYKKDSESLAQIMFIINNVILNFWAFAIIIVCTLILSFMLHGQEKWRAKAAIAANPSNQNKTLAKLVVAISIIFIACFSPVCIVFVIMNIFPEYSVDGGKYADLITLIGGVGCVLESINSSVNIFVYYRMSTKYRKTFNEVFINMRMFGTMLSKKM